MLLLALSACTGSSPTPPVQPATEPPEVPVPTGVTREYEWDVGLGTWDLWLNGELVVGQASGFTVEDEFWGPTVVCDLGDTVRITLNNLANEPIGITPTGMSYDADNDGLLRQAAPGESVTYTWQAMEGPGVFFWRSRTLDIKLREKQAMAGLMGAIVVRGRELSAHEPERMLNALFVRTYAPFTEVDDDIPGPWRHGPNDTACPLCVDTGLIPGDKHATHNQTLVLQEVTPNPAGEGAKNPWVTDSLEVPRVEIARGEAVRLHGLSYGADVTSMHLEGLTWTDPASGQTISTTYLAPGETTFAWFPELDAVGSHRIENFASTDYGLQSGWVNVAIPP